jgi:hypothetical protein
MVTIKITLDNLYKPFNALSPIIVDYTSTSEEGLLSILSASQICYLYADRGDCLFPPMFVVDVTRKNKYKYRHYEENIII